MKNTKVILTISIILLVLFIALATKFWFSYFLDLNSNGALTVKDNNYGTLELRTIKLQDHAEMHFGDINDAIEGYEFTVDNNKTGTVKYRLYIEDVPCSMIEESCSPIMTIKRSELNYALYLNGDLLKSGNLADVENDLIDTQVINIDVYNKYELRFWLDESADDIDGKYYHYRVKVEEVNNEKNN